MGVKLEVLPFNYPYNIGRSMGAKRIEQNNNLNMINPRGQQPADNDIKKSQQHGMHKKEIVTVVHV